MKSKTKRVVVKEGEQLWISVPNGKLATFKWDGERTYELVLADL